VIQLQAESPEASISFHILASGGKRGSHEPSILAEEGRQLKREHFGDDLSFFSCTSILSVISFIFKK